MAEQNIKMNVKTDTGYDTLYPQTKSDIVNFNDTQSIVKGKTVQENLKNTADALYHPNLLVNGDFQINTRGQGVYDLKAQQYTLDMWAANKLKISHLSNGVRVENLTADGHLFRQKYSFDSVKTYTACIKINNIKGSIDLIGENQISEGQYQAINLKLNLKKGINTVTFNANIFNIALRLQGNSSIDVEYFDVFEGKIPYPHKKETYAEAKLRCLPYIERLAMIGVHFDGSVYGTGISYIEKVDTPTIFNTKLVTGALQDVPIVRVKLNKSNIEYIQTKSQQQKNLYFSAIITCEP